MTKEKETGLTLAQGTAIEAVEQLASKYNMGALASVGRVQRAVMLARGVLELGRAIDPLMGDIMQLQNRKLGFLTDRDPRKGSSKPPYSVAEVKECVLEALLLGLNVCGNEWNIISGSCYVTKEGLGRLVAEVPGLTNLRISPGVPKMSEGGAVVRVHATWRLNGHEQMLTDEAGEPGRSIAVRLNAGMGVDGALGKATRKALAAIYQQVTGSAIMDGEAGDSEPPVGQLGARTSRVLEQLGAHPAVQNAEKAETPAG